MIFIDTDGMKKYAPAVVRIGIALVFLWFGSSQISSPANWTGMIPNYAMNILPLPPETLVVMHGLFEIVFGVLLLIGFQTRLAASLLTLNLVHIIFVVGYNDIGIRDFGLFTAMVSVTLTGADFFTLDSFWERKKRDGF